MGLYNPTMFVWIANEFAFYTLTASWLSMTNNVSTLGIIRYEYQKSKAATPEECYPSPPKPISFGWGISHGQLKSKNSDKFVNRT